MAGAKKPRVNAADVSKILDFKPTPRRHRQIFLVLDKQGQEGQISQADLQKTRYGQARVPEYWESFATEAQPDGVLAATGSHENHMLKVLKHRASGGVLTDCFVQWQGYRASEATWEPVGQANYLNTALVQEYAARKGLTLPEDLDLDVSEYSDSDVFADGDNNDNEGAKPGTVAVQEASDVSDEALLAGQILGDIHAAAADNDGEHEDADTEEVQDDEAVHDDEAVQDAEEVEGDDGDEDDGEG
ncbi:hypothetical protein FIE12Z_12537, partial [Fusarium flagelliforme]